LEGVDTSLPAGIDPAALASYCLMLGDDALIYSHRLQQWVTRAPELEEETALANIALDLLGQARMLLTRSARAEEKGQDEDRLAFWRKESDYRNVRMVERLDDDFAELVARLLVFSTWRLALLEQLRGAADPVLAAIAAMGVKELTYHRDYAAQWVVRLGDGTELSQEKMQRGLEVVWPYLDELFAAHPVEALLPGAAVDVTTLRPEFDATLEAVLGLAGLERPEVVPLRGIAGLAGRDGRHTEAMGYLLAELQSVARADPEATW
jgi:ring-1,2-phenylacetyl-CoA epoxidase subunit PaaC